MNNVIPYDEQTGGNKCVNGTHTMSDCVWSQIGHPMVINLHNAHTISLSNIAQHRDRDMYN